VLWAEGEIRQAAIFAEHLRLTRRIEADLGGREFRLTDTVRNAGFDLTPHMFLYHINVGWPLLEEGARFEAPIARTLWASDSVAAQGASHLVLGAPQPGFVEQVYAHDLTADGGGLVRRGWSTTGSGWPSSWSTTGASSRRSSSGCTCGRGRTRWGSSRARTRSPVRRRRGRTAR